MERHKRNSSERQFLLISEIRENVKVPCCSAGKKRRLEDGVWLVQELSVPWYLWSLILVYSCLKTIDPSVGSEGNLARN